MQATGRGRRFARAATAAVRAEADDMASTCRS